MAAGGAALAVPNARDREDRLGRSGGVLRGPIPEPRSTRELILLIATGISQNSPLEWLASFRLVFEYFKQKGFFCSARLPNSNPDDRNVFSS